MIHWPGKASSKRQLLMGAWNDKHRAVRSSGEIVQAEGTAGAKPQEVQGRERRLVGLAGNVGVESSQRRGRPEPTVEMLSLGRSLDLIQSVMGNQ